MSATEPGRNPRRSQAERRATTRGALLDACARQLSTAGYAATTTNAVAAAAGLSRGALQHTFEDRLDLMTAVMRDGYERLVAELTATQPTAGSVSDRVAVMIDVMLRAYGAPHAAAAFEVLHGERANAEFMAIHDDLLRAAESELDRSWLTVFADSGASEPAILQARRVARAAVLGLIARSIPLGTDEATAAALVVAVTSLIDPASISPAPLDAATIDLR